MTKEDEIEFEAAKASFLVFDKASGSRWLDEEKLKHFIQERFISKERINVEILDLINEWRVGEPWTQDGASGLKRLEQFASALLSDNNTQ